MRDTKGAAVWSRRLKELFAVITTGDGVVELVVPQEHSLLPAGPEGARKAARFFADSPSYIRLLSLAQIGFGVWPSLRQYQEE